VCDIIACKQLETDFTSLLTSNKVYTEEINFKAIRIYVTLRLRGIESVLKQRGPFGFFLNLTSNFADITDAEFNFTEISLNKVQ